jgi:hypothetical protein
MQLAIFSSTSQAGFAPEWTEEAAVAVFGSSTLDLTLHPPLADASLTVAAVFGSVKVIVPPGARVTTKGIALFGGSKVRVEPGTGPDLTINFLALFGEVSIIEGKQRAFPARAAEQPFPY